MKKFQLTEGLGNLNICRHTDKLLYITHVHFMSTPSKEREHMASEFIVAVIKQGASVLLTTTMKVSMTPSF